MNVSQEGVDDLDDLRDMKLINTLRMNSTQYQTVHAFQVSHRGKKVLRRKLTQSSQDAVDRCEHLLAWGCAC